MPAWLTQGPFNLTLARKRGPPLLWPVPPWNTGSYYTAVGHLEQAFRTQLRKQPSRHWHGQPVVMEDMLVLAALLLAAITEPAAAAPPPAVLTIQRLGHDYGVNVFADGHLERFIDEKRVLGPNAHVDPKLIRRLQALFKDLSTRKAQYETRCAILSNRLPP